MASRLDSLGTAVEDEEAELLLLAPVAEDEPSTVNQRSTAAAMARVWLSRKYQRERGFSRGEEPTGAGVNHGLLYEKEPCS